MNKALFCFLLSLTIIFGAQADVVNFMMPNNFFPFNSPAPNTPNVITNEFPQQISSDCMALNN